MIKLNIHGKLKAMISQLLNTQRYELKPVRVKAGRVFPGMPVHRKFPAAGKDVMRWK